MIKTRFAPSPTGFLHIGGARTALFSWGFARHSNGKFVLRIEDTDLERSTAAATQGILDGMAWLNLDYDEGPFYQTQRFARYKEVIAQMLKDGTAYYCYTSKEELEALRLEQEKNKEKPRYDGKWRPEEGKTLPPIPSGVSPVVRFKNPKTGSVVWHDFVKGRIEIQNSELDDLIIARADGTPTYNFCVVVDDFDMGITHVIRGDDHINNTPRQINILKALGAQIPEYAHLSMILGDDGKKLSKRHGAVSVMQYKDDGFLAEAVLNYLARLGFSHGDDEIFSREDFISWFDLNNITPSAAQFNTEKLRWINQHYLKQKTGEELKTLIIPFLKENGLSDSEIAAQKHLADIALLYADRVCTLKEMAKEILPFFKTIEVDQELLKTFDLENLKTAFSALKTAFENIDSWEKSTINQTFKAVLKEQKLKMPLLAMPIRAVIFNQTHTPSIDAVLEYLGKSKTLKVLDFLMGF